MAEIPLLSHLVEAMREAAFRPLDELGYLALTGKIEGRVRDNVAWSLHRRLAESQPRFLVAREWSAHPGEFEAYRRIDLAILSEAGKPELLVEFRAMYDGLTEIEKFRAYRDAVEIDLGKSGLGRRPFVGAFVVPIIRHDARDRTIIGKYAPEEAVGDEIAERLRREVEGYFDLRILGSGQAAGEPKGDVLSFEWWIVGPREGVRTARA